MHTSIRFIVLPLLVAAMVSLGIARAWGIACPPECSLGAEPAAAAQAGHSCCDGPRGEAADGAWPWNGGKPLQPAGCAHCSLYPGSSEMDDITMGSAPAGIEALWGHSGPAGIASVEPSPSAIPERPLYPRLRKAPDLFTRNCSFLI